MSTKDKLARDELERKFLFYDGQSVLRAKGEQGPEPVSLGPGETFAVASAEPAVSDLAPLPIFAVSLRKR